MPLIRWGTFGGNNLRPTTKAGTAQLAPKNQVSTNKTTHNRQFGMVSNQPVNATPDVAPNVSSKGLSAASQHVTTTNPLGENPTLGDTPVSHVTPDAVFITPTQLSRENRQWEGNITGHTVPKTIRKNLIQKINPSFGLSPAGSLNGTGGV